MTWPSSLLSVVRWGWAEGTGFPDVVAVTTTKLAGRRRAEHRARRFGSAEPAELGGSAG